ncbi:MAG: SDR family NAD(P)-dependent oxidoreductase [Betaproteobacteria bacterium]|nr:SDR family NAD(P)-dependent oxidoreductase [Betaproteobacteria bacterium]
MDLKGKHALVTGSTSGIGLGIAEGLAKAGVNLVLNGFGDKNDIEALRMRLATDYGVQVLYDGADMSKGSDIARMMSELAAKTGGIDIVVNNAGIQHVSPVEEFPDAKWDAILAINLSSAFHTTKAAMPYMKKRRWGRIVNIASAHGLVASPFKSAYVAAKHGIMGFTKTIALECAEDGVTVNAICPGYVLLLAAQPTKQFVTVEQIAATTLFLCSDAAASITGSHIAVEGGWTAH